MDSEDLGPDKEELPGQQNMFSKGDPASNKGARGRHGPAHLKGTRSLERLRARIDLAVKELNRLRDENLHLHREIEALKKGAVSSGDGSEIVFSESGPELRKTLEAYIGVLDRYIEEEASRPSSAE